MLMDGRKKLALPEIGSDPNRTYRLGIMGGTFDPIHYGHLVTAEQAREALGLDLVLFMPAGSPAFKLDQEVSSPEDRYAMTVLATAANEAFYTSRLEIDREGGPTPSIRSPICASNIRATSISTSSPALTRFSISSHGVMQGKSPSLRPLSQLPGLDTISHKRVSASRHQGFRSMFATSRFPPLRSARRISDSAWRSGRALDTSLRNR